MPPPSAAGATSNTARPAENRTNTEGLDPALVRRTVTAMVALSEAAGNPMRRTQAREVVLSYATGGNGPEMDGWSHWLRDWFGIADPTGESVARNLKRAGR